MGDYKVTIKVYLRNAGGAYYSYTIEEATKEDVTAKAREHLGQIRENGFRHSSGEGKLEWFPPHWIDKVKMEGDILTDYPSTGGGT